MRTTLAGGLAVLACVYVTPLQGQGFLSNARRVGMAGVNLTLDGGLRRYNPAYRAVKSGAIPGGAKIVIPAPLGLIQFFSAHPISRLSSDPMFHPDSASFNPVALANLILNPPLYYQFNQPPTPTNNVDFTIGKDNLIVNLGASQALIPADQFGFSGSSRLLDIEPGFGGFHAGVMVWLHEQVELQLGDSLLGFLKEGHPAQHNTLYDVSDSAIAETGFAPSIGWSGRLWGNDQRGLYFGVSGHYYMGTAFARSYGSVGFTTGDTIFAGPNPVRPAGNAVTSYSRFGNAMGHGVGGDVGFAWVSGPMAFGFGVNDIGATITWSDSRIDSQRWDTTANKIVTYASTTNAETKTKLPVSYLANVIYNLGSTTLGADLLNTGLGTTLHLGVEERLGPFAVRGGIGRDERKLVQFGWGGGVRTGPFGFDLGFWTHSNAFSDQRSITFATSISIY